MSFGDTMADWGAEDTSYLDGACALQMQTFLDDWHYRVLHAGMGMEVDRNEAVVAALGLFEGFGLQICDQEKEAFALMEEEDMIDAIVRKMSPDLQKNIEHFALQLQLIVSTATRVRGALETGDDSEVVSIMDHGDAGITQHIMKRTVVTAGYEIVELKDVHEGWSKDMGSRLNRLSTLAEEQERNRQELDKVNAEIAAFHGQQNAKAIKAITGMADQSNSTLLKASFGGWSNWYIRSKGEKHIHEKYQAEIVLAKQRLKDMQGKSTSCIKRSLMANSDKADNMLLADCVRRWGEDVKREKADRLNKLKYETDVANLECLRSDQKAAAKRNLMRMTGESDESLITMVFTSWARNKAEEKKQKDFEEREAKLQADLARMKSGAKGGNKGVLQRVSENSASGVMGNVFVHWRDHTKTELRARNMEETLLANENKFKSLNQKQKGNAKNAAQSAIELEEHNTTMNIFMNWKTEVEIQRTIAHYSTKMKGKKEQLEQVHTMFKDFSSQLEQGLVTTPRTEKRSGHKSKGGGGSSEKPPALPSQ